MATDSDLMNVRVEEDEEDIMASVADEVGQQAVEKAKRKLREGLLPPLYMPKEADDKGERIATIRFFTPLNGPNGGTKVIEHHRFQGVRTVCRATFGLPCQLCTILMERSEIADRAKLYENAAAMAKYANPVWSKDEKKAKKDFKTEWVYIWTLWHREYEAFDNNDEEGGQVVVGWYHNDNSPIDGIFRVNNDMLHPEEGEPLAITGYDIKLVQIGEQTKKRFYPREKAPKPFDQMHRVRQLTKTDMKFIYAINIAYGDTDWQEWLMKAWKQTQQSGTATKKKRERVDIELD